MFPSYFLLRVSIIKDIPYLRDGLELHNHIEFCLMQCPTTPSKFFSVFKESEICPYAIEHLLSV